MVSDRALWQAINAHNLDAADAALPFSRRLMRETGWTQDFAKRAIHEYKAFIYLVCTGGTLLAPSETVDRVWHLHLIYTRDYWDRFCAQVLKRPVHHSPSMGGEAEDALYGGAYERTRRLYRAEFGTAPPQEFWPDAATQPATPPVNRSDHIHLPKRQVFLCLAAGAAAILTGCTAQDVGTLWRDYRSAGFAGMGFFWWLWMTFANRKAIFQRGVMGYLLGSVVVVPFAAFCLHSFLMAVDPDWRADWAWILSAMTGTALWIHIYLAPRGKGGGSGCGSGCGGNSDSGGGHGCGGHGCGASCGGGCGGH